MSILSSEAHKAQELKDYIATIKSSPGPLMPVMQKAQEIFGYLPMEVQDLIANELEIPMSEVYGVATFYSQFAIEPKGENIIGVCMGTACYVRNAEKVLNRFSELLDVEVGKTTPDNKFTLEATRCLGCCGLAPVIMVGEQVFGRLTGETKEIQEIINKF